MKDDFKSIYLIKKGHRYMIRYKPGEETAVLECLIAKADDKDCPLDWFDAAVMSHQLGSPFAGKMQELMKKYLSPP